MLDLADLTEAISDDAFSIRNPRHPSNRTTRVPLPPRSLSSFLSGKESDDTSSVFTSETDEEEGEEEDQREDLGFGGIGVPGGGISIERDRKRHSSLTSRLFGVASSSSATVNKPPSISDSIKSASSVGSTNSARGKRKVEGAGYAEWMGWKSWSKGSKPKEVPAVLPVAKNDLGGAASVLGDHDGMKDEMATLNEQDTVAGEAGSNSHLQVSDDINHDRSISTSTYLSAISDGPSREEEDWFTSTSGTAPHSGALSSSTLSANSSASRPGTFSTNDTVATTNTADLSPSDGPSSPVVSPQTGEPTITTTFSPTGIEVPNLPSTTASPDPTDAPSATPTLSGGSISTSPDSVTLSLSPSSPRSSRRALPSTATSTPAPMLLRSTSRSGGGGGLPSLLSPTHANHSNSLGALPPSLSTPILPVSTFTSSQELARPPTTSTATILEGEAGDEGAANLGKRNSTHFQAVVWAADEWALRPGGVGEREEVFWRYERVGGKVRSLVERLLGNVVVDQSRKGGLLQRPLGRRAKAGAEGEEEGGRYSPSGSSIMSLSKSKVGDGERSYLSSGFGSTISRAFGLGLGGMNPAQSLRDRERERDPRSPSPPPEGIRRTGLLSSSSSAEPNLTLFPKLSTLSKYSPFAQPALSTPSPRVSLSTTSSALSVPTLSTVISSPSPSTLTSTKSFVSAPTTMELDFISSEPPPTLAQNVGSNGSGNGVGENGPLVDRYGFVYDVRSGMQLLRDARKKEEVEKERAKKLVEGEGEEERDEGDGDGDGDALLEEQEGKENARIPEGVEEAASAEREKKVGEKGEVALEIRTQSQEEIEEELAALREALGLPPASTANSTNASTNASPAVPRSPVTSMSRDDSYSGSGGLPKVDENERTTTLMVESTQFLSPPAGANSTSTSGSTSPRPVRSNSIDRSPATPTPNTTGGPQSMKRLLSQLGEMHDAVEKVQKEAWEAFIRRRQATLSRLQQSHSSNSVALSSTGGGGAPTTLAALMGENSTMAMGGEEEANWSDNLVGIAQMGNVAGKSGKEDWEEFKKLVRKGIPISYRPK